MAALLSLALPGCNGLFNEQEAEKTEAELRAERNKPIYEQFIGDWDEYFDGDYSLVLPPSLKITVSDSEFTLTDGSHYFITDVNYSGIIYTLEEFKAESDYPGTVRSNDLTRDGFIKLKYVYNDILQFHEYHFYDNDTFSLKIVTTDGNGGIRYYKRTGSGGNNNSGDTVDLPGNYGLTAGTYNCTLTFNTDGTYVFDHPVGSNDRSGTWTQNGSEVTLTYTVPGSVTISEEFITTEEGDIVTLTLKDSSVGISQILASFQLVATSVALTKI
jgi:hypothetical protein